MANELIPGAEFQPMALEAVVATPMLAAVKAQAVIADATQVYIERLIDPATRRPKVIDFTVDYRDDTGFQSTEIRAPLLSIIPVPHLRIDSLNVQFRYEVTQTVKDTQATELGVELGAKSGVAVSPWVDATFRGSVVSKSAGESMMNRSGSLDITVHASEAPIPEGLAKLLTMLSNSVSTGPFRHTGMEVAEVNVPAPTPPSSGE